MAYELKRAKRIMESVSIGGEEVPVVLDLDTMAADFTRKYNAVIRAETEIRKHVDAGVSADNLEEVQASYGNAIIALFEMVFGTEGARKILAFYEHKYIEMLTEVLPFLLEVVVPALNQAAAEKREKLANIHKAKQRNRFFRGGRR